MFVSSTSTLNSQEPSFTLLITKNSCLVWWWMFTFFCLVLNLLTNWLSGYLVQTSRSTPNAKLNLLEYRGCTNLFNATLLILGLVNYEFPTKLRCRLSGTVAPLGICYRESFLVSYLRYIYRLWNTLPQGQGIPYLSTYSYIYTPSYQIPT